jgi:hypothetical protein
VKVIDMIRASFGDEIAKKASELIQEGKIKQQSFLQIVQEAERALFESQIGPISQFEQLETNSHLVEDIPNADA